MDLNNINRDRDTSGLGPIEYDQTKVPALIRKHADNVRNKTYGQEVREGLARGIEYSGLIAGEASTKVIAQDKKINHLDIQFGNAINAITVDTEVIDARVDAMGTSHETLKSRLDSDMTNPILLSNAVEYPTFGSDLMTNSTVSLSSNWTGNLASGFTHISGAKTPLIITLNDLERNQVYKVEVSISKPNPADTAGKSDYYITLGGTDYFETYRGQVSNQIWGIRAGGTNKELYIEPNINFNGTLSFSVKKISVGTESHTEFYDRNNDLSSELRVTNSDINSFYIGRNSGSESFGEPDESNVSLGNDALRDNTSGFWNTSIGSGTMALNTVGSRNVAIGYIALQQNISGDRNIAIGTFSLLRNKSGRSNIALGADSLWFNDSGDLNVAIGLVAMGNNKDGSYNVGIGDHALGGGEHGVGNVALGRLSLMANEGDENIGLGTQPMYRHVTGNGNIALGYWSMYEHVDGKDNIAIGYRSMDKSTEGNNNIAIGRESLANSTASSNIAIGQGALKYHTTDINNVALGIASMAFHTTGRGNVGIGATSGRDFVTGQDNVFIGLNAGYNLKHGDKNILIGYNVAVPQTTYSNFLNIGDVIKSNDTTTGEVLISKLTLTALPYTDPKIVGALWDDDGTVKRSKG